MGTLKKTSLIAVLGMAIPFLFAQDARPGSTPPVPSQTALAGAQLIAWSVLQKPQPVQQNQEVPDQSQLERHHPSPQPYDPSLCSEPATCPAANDGQKGRTSCNK
jgi:hypothetical protein